MKNFITQAIATAIEGLKNEAGGPFGALVVDKNGKVIGKGCNSVTSTNDPTAHAEIVAIRAACKYVNSFQLTGCTIFTSCEPCPMCLSAIYWARAEKIVYACSRKDAADIGFDDDFIYQEIPLSAEKRSIPCTQMCRKEGLKAFQLWVDKENKVKY